MKPKQEEICKSCEGTGAQKEITSQRYVPICCPVCHGSGKR